MIKELSIENVALIDKLTITLGDGLNILSGETGAGKSIIIDSLNFVLGERADKTLIRYGTGFAVVQAVFEDYLTPSVGTYLEDVGIECEDVLILRRKMTVEGKNECRINGRVATLSILKGLTELLVDIHGQHEHQSLLKPSNHLNYLDSMGESAVKKAREDVENKHKTYHSIKNELESFGDTSERARRIDVLNYQIEEIERVDIKDGEEESLLAKRKLIRNAEKVLSALVNAKSLLDSDDGNGTLAELKSSSSVLKSISGFDEEIPSLIDRLDSSRLEIEDIVETISSLVEKLDFDSRTADKVEERLEEVRNLLRKYGGSYEKVQEFLQNAKDERDRLSGADEHAALLENEIKVASAKLLESSKKLTSLRQKTANSFEKSVIKELSDLGMGNSTFKVAIESTENVDEISAVGADNVEFLISPNLGEPLKPLAKIISGGEMSRFMLAIKNIVARVDGIGTMVFDEIDTGISGHISAIVSQKLCNISRGRQVIAVTHMPSLAAMADSHYLISKSVTGGKTVTNVVKLDDDTDEVARLIGGNDYSKYAVPHAKEMKLWAENYKADLAKK